MRDIDNVSGFRNGFCGVIFNLLNHSPMKTSKVACSALLFVMFLVSCQVTETTPKYTSSQFKSVGEQHNQALNAVFQALKDRKSGSANRDEGKMTVSELLDLNQSTVVEYMAADENALGDQNIKRSIERSKQISSSFLNSMVEKNNTGGRKASDLANIILDETAPYLSVAQYNMTVQIISLCEIYENDISGLQVQLDIIEGTISSLPTEEQPVMFEAVSVARSSATYWYHNYDSWIEEVQALSLYDENGNPIVIQRTNYPSRGAWIAGSDVAGAVAVGLVCAASGPVGWAWALKACSLGAAVASGAAAIITSNYK